MAKSDFDLGSKDNGNAGEAGNSNGSGSGEGSDARPVADVGAGERNAGSPAFEVGDASASTTADTNAAPTKKRRGRAAFPRDANGAIIYPEGYVRKGKEPLDLGFTPNDKAKVREQIQGIHAAASMLMKQPVLLLNDNEAIEFSNNLCAVLDYHHINITSAGGPGMLYVMLLITTYNIYNPRIKALRAGGGQEVPNTAGPSTTPPPPPPNRPAAGMMDFSGDIQQTMQ